jgi:DnaJ-class molecular chaperone
MRLFIVYLFVCLSIWGEKIASATNQNRSQNINPYHVLEIQKDASQDEIRKSYRKLCLKHHPDKNVNASEKERRQSENMFKRIQEANSLIGTPEDRRKYDSSAALQARYGHGMGTQQSMAEEAFRQYFQQQARDPFGRAGNPYGRTRRAFYVNGIDVSHLFNGGMNGMNPFANESRETSTSINNEQKSIYEETVTIPLEDLYNGVKRKEFELKETIVKRYHAAFQGGIATKIATQCFFTSLPLLIRVSWPASVISFAATFHISLPRPTRLVYASRIKPGWKGGTKLKFEEVEPGVDVVFVLKEGKHDRFRRDGNDLETSIQIGKSKARKGCKLFIESLGNNEMPIIVKLKRGEITQNNQVVTVKGKGWPKSGGGAGDLKIIVNIISDSRAKRLKRRKVQR